MKLYEAVECKTKCSDDSAGDPVQDPCHYIDQLYESPWRSPGDSSSLSGRTFVLSWQALTL